MSSIVCNQVSWSEYVFVYTEAWRHLLKYNMTATNSTISLFLESNYLLLFIFSFMWQKKNVLSAYYVWGTLGIDNIDMVPALFGYRACMYFPI